MNSEISKPRLSELAREMPGATKGESLSPGCALSRTSSACRICLGKGVVINTAGVYTSADLCSCVSTCTACFGKCRISVDGASKPCRSPSPARVVTLMREARIPMKYSKATLDAFTNYTGNGREVIQYIHNWLKVFQSGVSRGVLLSGPVGVGKTFILAAIAKSLALRGYSVRFVDFFQLLSELKTAYSNDQSDDAVLAPLIHCDVLVVDELGKGRSTDWELTILDHLITGRYNQNKAMVASTNYLIKAQHKSASPYNIDLEFAKQEQRAAVGGFSPDEFGPLEPRVGKRIYSRLFEMAHLLDLSGQDYRRLVREDAGQTAGPAIN